jgi:hypothetical protein
MWGIFADKSLINLLLHEVIVRAIARDMPHLTTGMAGQTVVFGRASCASCTTLLEVYLPSSSFHSVVSDWFEASSRLGLHGK